MKASQLLLFPFFLLLILFLLFPVFSSACTIGAFGPSSTWDGRPILWKNRDVKNELQAMLYSSRGRYRFIANVYAGETLDVWAGINEAGFAIMNSNSYNIGGKTSADARDDDGLVMRLALENCATVDDFARLLDSLNRIGRETPANYGVFDATGRTAIFEAANTYYRRYDADQESLDMLIRANYSYHGNPARQTGKARHDRAWQLAAPVARKQGISPEFVATVLAPDMGTPDFDPYPLPFRNNCGDLPYGYIPSDTTICRTTTRSVQILVGNKPGQDPAGGMMFILLGPPETSLPIPLWVAAEEVPLALTGKERSRICDEAIALRGYVRSDPNYPTATNTFALYRLRQMLDPVAYSIFAQVHHYAETWAAGPSKEQARAISEAACRTYLALTESFWRELRESSPNPLGRSPYSTILVRDVLTVTLPAQAKRMQVYDALGSLRAELTLSEQDKYLRWSPRELTPGRYFLRFAGASEQSVSFIYAPLR